MQRVISSFLPAVRWLTLLLPLLMVTGPAPADIAVSLVAVLFLVHSWITRDWQWLRTPWLQWLLALWAYMCVRNLFLDDGGMGALRALSWLRFPVFVSALIGWVLPSEVTRERLWNCLVVAVLLLVVDSFWQYFHHVDIVGRHVTDSGRLTGPFSNPRVGITITWLLFPMLAALYNRYDRSNKYLLAVGTFAAATVVTVYITGERTALLLLLAGLGLMFITHRTALRTLPLVSAIALLAISILSHTNQALVQRQVGETQKEVGGFWQGVYGQTWIMALHIGEAHPIFGVGSKQFQTECKKPIYGPTDKTSLSMRCPMHSHNHYLELLVEYGAIGVLLFLGFLASWYRVILMHWRNWYQSGLAIGLFISTGIWLWPISITPSQFVPWAAIPFWLFMGWFTWVATETRKP